MRTPVDGRALNFVGTDLAWGEKAQTGLAAFGSRGKLLDVAGVKSDDEIAAWLAPYLETPCLVAVDAPIIVENASGRRPCEALVGRHFARFHAGAYPANTSLASFANGTRALRLAQRFGLDVDPASKADLRMIEVYPHPAMVMLFGLDRVLPYKGKRGRTVDSRHAAFDALASGIESLVHRNPGIELTPEVWEPTLSKVDAAVRHFELDRIEDPLDAIIAAYVGMQFDLAPDQTRTFGDVASGYIVTSVDEAMAAEIDNARMSAFARSSGDTLACKLLGSAISSAR